MVGVEERHGEEDDLGDGDAVAEADDAVAGTHGEDEILAAFLLLLLLLLYSGINLSIKTTGQHLYNDLRSLPGLYQEESLKSERNMTASPPRVAFFRSFVPIRPKLHSSAPSHFAKIMQSANPFRTLRSRQVHTVSSNWLTLYIGNPWLAFSRKREVGLCSGVGIMDFLLELLHDRRS